MNARDAEKEFRSFLQRRGTSFEALGAVDGLDAMVCFYREVRTDSARFEEDEDMLLFQWGCYEEDDGVAFLLDITRQLIFDEPEEHSIWQLHLSFYFNATDELRALKSGERWCQSPDAVPSFATFLANHPAAAALRNRILLRKRLQYGRV